MNVVQKNGLEMMPDNKRNEDQFPLLVRSIHHCQNPQLRQMAVQIYHSRSPPK